MYTSQNTSIHNTNMKIYRFIREEWAKSICLKDILWVYTKSTNLFCKHHVKIRNGILVVGT